MKTVFRIVTISLLFCLAASSAFAHKVRVFAYTEGDNIVGETAFSGGKAAKNVAIEIYNEADNAIITETKTNDRGEFSFPIPDIARAQRLNLRIVVNGGDGHKNSWLLNAEEYLPAAETDNNKPAQTSAVPTPDNTTPAQKAVPAQPDVDLTKQLMSEETLRRIVEESVEKQLRPVKHMLAANKEKQISLQDIISGLGYIFGLAGVAAYFSSRKKTEKGEQ